jgi:hypothetical protein
MPQKIVDAARKTTKTTKEAAKTTKTMPRPTARSSVSSATRKVIMPTLVLQVKVEMVAVMETVAAEAIMAVDAMAEVDVKVEVVVDSTKR